MKSEELGNECIDGDECEGYEYFEYCSNEKVDTIYRLCKHILNNDEQVQEQILQKVKVKWNPIKTKFALTAFQPKNRKKLHFF